MFLLVVTIYRKFNIFILETRFSSAILLYYFSLTLYLEPAALIFSSPKQGKLLGLYDGH